MVLAYILVTTKGGIANQVAKEITNLKEVSSVHLIYGEYDIITRVKIDNLDKLREFTLKNLSNIRGVDKTTTLIVADQTKEDDNLAKL